MAFPSGTLAGKSLERAFHIRMDLSPADPNAVARISGDVFIEEAEPANFYLSFYSDSDQITFHSDGKVEAMCTVYQRWPTLRMLKGVFQIFEDSPGVWQAGLALYERGVLFDVIEMRLELQSKYFREFTCFIDFQDATTDAATLGALHQRIDDRLAQVGVKCNTQLAPAAFGGGTIGAWTENDLYQHMFASFPEHKPRGMAWLVSLLVVSRFRDSNTTGIMFDNKSEDWDHRQGIAVFWETRAASPFPSLESAYARTVIHELGHALNLMHSFEPMKPGGPRAHSLSFMNYPDKYIDGIDSYWHNFEWKFDSDESDHIFHNFLDEVVMGGAQFAWQPREGNANFMLAGSTRKGLRLDLRVRRYSEPMQRVREDLPETASFRWGQPVVLEAKLANVVRIDAEVQDTLAPHFGETVYLIRNPMGRVTTFQPLWTRCHEGRSKILDPNEAALYEEINLTYGAGGFSFQEPGRYQVQAIHWSKEGMVRSAPLNLFVEYPTPQIEKAVFPLFDGRVGTYIVTQGLPALYDFVEGRLDFLRALPPQERNAWLDYFRCCHGYLMAVGVKRIVQGKVECWRPADDEPAKALLDLLGLKRDGTRARKKPAQLSNLAFSWFSGRLTDELLNDGKKKAAAEVADNVLGFMKAKHLPKAVSTRWLAKYDSEQRLPRA